MRRSGLLNVLCSILGLVFFLFLALVEINNVVNFIDVTGHEATIEFIQKFGALIILAVLVFANFVGKTIFKIVMFVLIFGVGILFVLSTFFPNVVKSIFGSGGNAEAAIAMVRDCIRIM